MADQPDAFIILPFDDPFEDLFDDHLVPVFEEAGYDINKADSLDSQRNILENIVQGILNADILVADLTGSNPNVFYELGIAHGVDIPTVLITKDLEELPFDLQAYETIEYSLRYDEVEEFRDKLTSIAESHKKGEMIFGNPVSDYSDGKIPPSNRTNLEDDSEEPEEDGEDRKKKEIAPDKGILDYASESDERLSSLQENVEHITERTYNLGEEIESYTDDINDLENKQGSNARKRANAIARDVAAILSSYSETIENRTSAIDEDLSFIMDAEEKLIEFTDASNPEQREILEDEREELNEFIKATNSAIDGLSQLEQEASGLTGINRELTKSSRDVSSTLSTLISILQEGSATAERYINLIDQELSD